MYGGPHNGKIIGQRGRGVARKPAHQLSRRKAVGARHARLEGDAPRQQRGARLLHSRRRAVIIAGRHAAGQKHHVAAAQPPADERFDLRGAVPRRAERFDNTAVPLKGRGQRIAVAVADFPRGDLAARAGQLAAGGNQAHPGPPVHSRPCDALRGERPGKARVDDRPVPRQKRAGTHILTGADDVFARCGRREEGNAFAGEAGLFVHDDGVCPRRDGRARHHPRRRAGRYRPAGHGARRYFLQHGQGHRRAV